MKGLNDAFAHSLVYLESLFSSAYCVRTNTKEVSRPWMVVTGFACTDLELR